MEKTALSKEDLDFIKQKIKTYNNLFYILIVIISLVFYGFYYFHFLQKNTEPTSKSTLLMEFFILLFLICILIKGYERQIKLKKNLSNQMIIKGSFKILEKRITNKNDSDSWKHNVLKIFSELENKDKFIFMDNDDFRTVNVGDFIYLEYFTDCDLIKRLEFNNRKLEYTRDQIHDYVYG